MCVRTYFRQFDCRVCIAVLMSVNGITPRSEWWSSVIATASSAVDRQACSTSADAFSGSSTSSLLKNLEIGALLVFFALGFWGGRDVVRDADLRRQQFGNADQIVGDQIEHEVGSDAG